jgi:hypothetical protein
MMARHLMLIVDNTRGLDLTRPVPPMDATERDLVAVVESVFGPL